MSRTRESAAPTEDGIAHGLPLRWGFASRRLVRPKSLHLGICGTLLW
jgi:hypothetical protein